MVTTELMPQELAEMVVKRDTLLAEYRELTIVDEASKSLASVALAKVRTFKKQIEEIAKKARKPLKDDIAKINQSEQFILGDCITVEAHIVKEQQVWRNKELAGQAKEQARQNRLADNRAERAEQRGETRPLPEGTPPIVQGPAKTIENEDGSKVIFVTTWKFEIVQPAKLPREFLMADEVKIGQYVRAMKQDAKIDGVRIFSVQTPKVMAER